MLDRVKMLSQLQAVNDKLFLDLSAEYSLARASFERIIADPQFQEKIQTISTPWLIPSWQGPLDAAIAVTAEAKPYSVLAVDGSQIYPDRHQGTGCFLVNIGTVFLEYGELSKVHFETEPFVFTGEEDGDDMIDLSVDVVNAKRQELEFKKGLAFAAQRENNQLPFLFLFDGSLIFWHLESKEAAFKQKYLSYYIGSLLELYQKGIACAGYISLPKNKELLNLLRVEMCNLQLEGCTTYKAIDHLIDTSIAHFFLTPGTRSTIFKSSASICSAYPDYLVPHFYYLHVGCEIVRIEIPAWLAADEAKIAQISAIILDQTNKGQGYPVSLAESHEQAVVKGPDREFFYQVINKFAFEQKVRIAQSQKSIKKRGLGI